MFDASLIYILLGILLFFVSFFLTFIYRKWAVKQSILDIPNERSSHFLPIPRGGGIAIILTWFTAVIIGYLNDQIDTKLFYALIAGLIIAVLGIIDDFKGISVNIRFFVQFLCSGFALYLLGGFIPIFGKYIITLWSIFALFGIVWFINLFNFMDGSDGYASMEVVSVALSCWFFTGSNFMLFLCFCVAGFLVWNWPHAKIFMGDSGSTTLGYILVIVGIYFQNTNQLNFGYWIILTSLFWFDASFTLIRRIIGKENLSKAHKNHMYQRAIQGGFSHLKTMLAGFVINVLLFTICLCIKRNIFPLIIGMFITISILTLALLYVNNKFPYKI